jgi:F-type H+-transporting ATPase subunit c
MENVKWLVYYLMTALFIAGFSITLATWLAAFGQSKATAKAMEGIARQPEAAGRMFLPLMIGLGLLESLVLYVLLVSMLIILMFAAPAAEKLLKLL